MRALQLNSIHINMKDEPAETDFLAVLARLDGDKGRSTPGRLPIRSSPTLNISNQSWTP